MVNFSATKPTLPNGYDIKGGIKRAEAIIIWEDYHKWLKANFDKVHKKAKDGSQVSSGSLLPNIRLEYFRSFHSEKLQELNGFQSDKGHVLIPILLIFSFYHPFRYNGFIIFIYFPK